MGFFLRLLRESQLRRGKLPRMRRLDVLPRAREGVFRLGVCSGGGELAWAPLQGDPPHLLWAGTTGSGKTRGMVLMGLQALDWGWDVEVIDWKGGGDYWVLASGGATIRVDHKAAVAALKAASKDIESRNRAMWQTPMIRESELDGRLVEDRAVNFNDLDESVKSEHGWKPRLVLIDETASLAVDKKNGGMEALRAAVQLGRSAGVHIVLGMQRPDADLLEGFIKHNIQARILSGPSDQLAEQMVHGSAVGAIADSDRVQPRPPGRGIASGFGPRPGASLFQAFLLSPDRYLPYTPAPSAPAAAGGDDGVTSEGGGTEASVSPGTPPGISSIYPFGSPVRSILLRPSARLRLRLSALRLLVRPLRSGPFVRDPALAEACKRDAGRCRACGSDARLEADHRRPLWAGGQDRKENMQVLCFGCHKSKSGAEATVRALMRRMRGRSGYGRPRMVGQPHQWLLALLALVGLIDGRWHVVPEMWRWGAIVAFGLGCWWQLAHNGISGEDDLLDTDAKAERKRYRKSLSGLHVASSQGVKIAKFKTRVIMIWLPGAYLLGVFGPGLVF